MRRIGLATIYKMTELYMIQDKSPDHNKTWEFLARRIEEAGHLHDFLDKTGDGVPANIQEVLTNTFTTVRKCLRLV